MYDGQEYKTIPKLKLHLESEWEKAGIRAKAVIKSTAERAAKRPAEEEGESAEKKLKSGEESTV
jgi:hypothetical protein